MVNCAMQGEHFCENIIDCGSAFQWKSGPASIVLIGEYPLESNFGELSYKFRRPLAWQADLFILFCTCFLSKFFSEKDQIF